MSDNKKNKPDSNNKSTKEVNNEKVNLTETHLKIMNKFDKKHKNVTYDSIEPRKK